MAPGQSLDEFVSRLRECVVNAFDRLIVHYEEEIRKADAKRGMVGWNFNEFFLIKEGLAFVLERFKLTKLALKQYYELEVRSFLFVAKFLWILVLLFGVGVVGQHRVM